MSDLAGGGGGGNGPESPGSVCLGGSEPPWALWDAQGRTEGSEQRWGQREVIGQPTGGSWAPLSGSVRPPRATNGFPAPTGDTPEVPGGSEGVSVSGARHDLKTWPEYFAAVVDGRKPFDVRRDDRGFLAGDVVVLREFDPFAPFGAGAGYSGRAHARRVTYVLRGDEAPGFGIAPGFCVLGLGAEAVA